MSLIAKITLMYIFFINTEFRISVLLKVKLSLYFVNSALSLAGQKILNFKNFNMSQRQRWTSGFTLILESEWFSHLNFSVSL